MHREVITETTVARALKLARTERRRVIVRDHERKAFALRVSANGVVSYVLQYTDAEGKQRLYTLPETECATPSQARSCAERLRDKIRADKSFDPLRNRKIGREAQEIEQSERHSVAELCDKWIATHSGKKSLRSDIVLINAHVKPKLGQFWLDELMQKDIEKAMHAIAPHHHQANRFLSLVSAMLNFAASKKGDRWLTTANEATGIERFDETPRERKLSPEETSRFLTVLDQYRDTIPGRQVQLLMLTLSRRAEVLGARWSEFDLHSTPGYWFKPASRTKLGKTVRVPVVGGALELLRQMKAAARPGDDRLFYRRPEGEIIALRRFWSKLTAEAGLSNFRVHDLRHVGATVLASSGVPLFVIAKLLGHANESRVTVRYSHLTDDAAEKALAALSTSYRRPATALIEAPK